MKTARERAIDIAYEFIGKGFSREMFRLMIEDHGDNGESARRVIGAIERGIERDRADVEKTRQPS